MGCDVLMYSRQHAAIKFLRRAIVWSSIFPDSSNDSAPRNVPWKSSLLNNRLVAKWALSDPR